MLSNNYFRRNYLRHYIRPIARSFWATAKERFRGKQVVFREGI